MPSDKPSIFYILLSRKFWMSLLSMLVAVGVLTFSDAEQAEMVSAIVGGLGAVYTIAVALEDGMRASRGPVQVAQAEQVTIEDKTP